MPVGPEYEFHVDDEPYTLDDYTYAEQRLLRDTVREQSGNSEAEIYDVDGIDRFPAMYWIIKRRTAPDLTLEDVLENVKPTDLLREVPKGKAKTKAPTPAK